MSTRRTVADILAQARGNLAISRAIVLDWHDGPIDGYLRLPTPSSAWRFQLLAEHYGDEDVDSRVYLLSEVPVELWDKLADSLADRHEDTSIMWVPSWQFKDDEARAAADEAVARLEESVDSPALLVSASATMTVSEAWEVRTGVVGPHERNQS